MEMEIWLWGKCVKYMRVPPRVLLIMSSVECNFRNIKKI